MWSLGCVAAELFLREPLFQPNLFKEELQPERSILLAQLTFLGAPRKDTSTHAWMKSLPFAEKFLGKDARYLPAKEPPEWPPERLQGCPPQLADFVQQTLQWQPQERLAAASASLHSFVSSRALSVPVAVAKGKNGLGSIAAGFLDEEVLEYLQKCPTWAQYHTECQQNNFEPNHCISPEEGQRRKKREFVGYIDANNPPKSKSLNGDANLPLIKSERLACFGKALRRGAQAWLHQLTARLRAEIRRQKLPSELLAANGAVFMEEDLADNALVYASVQLFKIGAREDGWHTDDGSSLLHASVTILGSRTLLVEVEDAARSSEGSFCLRISARRRAVS